MSDELKMLNAMRKNPDLAEIMDNDPACKALEASMISMEKAKRSISNADKTIARLGMERDAALLLATRYKKALLYYADPRNWKGFRPLIAVGDMDELPDNGDLARAALGPET